jgi:hypothetical protein
MSNPSIGRIVHFVYKENIHLPGIITRVDITQIPVEVDITIFGPLGSGHVAKPNHDEINMKVGSWHWPEIVVEEPGRMTATTVESTPTVTG